MKKTLFLVRHATAESEVTSGIFKDIDRELTSVGMIEAARMARFLADEKHEIHAIYTSPAARAKATAQIFTEQLHFPSEHIEIEGNLYGNGAKGYLNSVNLYDEKHQNIMLFGHNPDITFFLEYLCKDVNIGSMEKAGVAIIEFSDINWKEISHKTGKLVAYHIPTR